MPRMRLVVDSPIGPLAVDLDGNEIMRLLGIRPGPAVGKAYKHLLALRIERGPLGREQAEAELRAWAADNLT